MASEENKNLSKHEKRELKNKLRLDKKDDKRSYKLEKIKEVTAKFYAVAAKRKWLFLIIAAAIVAYLVIFKGGFSFGGGEWLQKIKGLF